MARSGPLTYTESRPVPKPLNGGFGVPLDGSPVDLDSIERRRWVLAREIGVPVESAQWNWDDIEWIERQLNP